MADIGLGEGDPHDEIVRLEAQIDKLADRLESCRKFILAGRIAVAAGAIVLGAVLIGALPFDPPATLAAMGAVLGGFVVWGSNRSTANEAAAEMAAAEARRAALIGQIQLRIVGGRATLH
jgi:undecaprenyl pyrophosphate phosphatase UppP